MPITYRKAVSPLNKKANLLMFLAILATSTGSIFAKAADAPALAVSAYRLGLSALIVVPAALIRTKGQSAPLSSKDWRDGILSGVALALHFAFWISSLDYISIASCVVLVNSTPLWVAIAAPFATGDKMTKKTAAAVAVAVTGAVIIGFGDFSSGPEAWKGDGLALAGAVTLTAYLLLGRRVREKVPLLPYVAMSYGSAAVFLWALLIISGGLTFSFQRSTWAAFWAMALIPQIFGHSAYNWALKYVSPAVVSIILLGEPIGSSVMAWIFFGERPGAPTAVGGALVLSAIYMAQKEERAG